MMETIKVKIINKSNNPLPEYKTEGSAGMDLRAYLTEEIILKPGEYRVVPTGIYVEIPVGFQLNILARSGFAAKYGISLVNGVGLIDSDYRGELGVILINHGKEDFKIANGDRIAQMVLNRYEKMDLEEVEILSETERGEGGFGSTGK